MKAPINVLGGPIQACSHAPKTGWFRDGCCNTDDSDTGSHTVCCQVTWDFLEFLKSQGNDLMTPAMQFGFPGLKDGDRWCVCAPSWAQAFDAGKACPVFLEGTHAGALRYTSLDALLAHAVVESGAVN